ncbi:alpha-ketoacid dehydrogenase subunit beta [Brevibacillus borstelensis]|jgi:acetoin:2,6-dichlorophenolindophenol oxidoreductase subunit beta|uniref:alpha-ketoacid dehydrogenase subunit beta n=1 Tax=Brevibacillus TaxID=55080 RepID=UPI0004699469|nr:alpha-ketoacid dehydrogenase subunit beta [Brevibacillus borstelensis]MBE5396886.1 alpha-ketoacid dehydrogenase subunit beta [Brevibacillus borstelensis]MED1875126.1 alpha-ketoacid dehydrogenase subunit beta [Brevibacillus borstelensis]MED1884187.1 alpha-ketoacid dehydrogenase subunit beta [Brevibacillus borstelensis]RNB64155.1 alpha-ketoacid dehydrogenase subunit beta [Brevibacillus borstelensis]WNF06003.1 alpha-ketoacid dehydrogenase subunit beta [Brevibacillus borstelensis]
MRNISFSQATLEAMQEEMRRDERVFIMGEDIASQGGIFGQFKGLPKEFGLERVRDTPISETALVGAGIGAALAGAVPVVDMHFADFIGVTMDEVLNQMAKIRYMFGGQATLPLVLRAPDGVTRSAAAQHSQSLEAWFLHIPGLKVVIPSNPADAKGLLKAAIRDQNPVIYFEHKDLFSKKGPVPDGDYLTPIGKAAVVREGKDVTIVSYSAMLGKCLEAADQLGSLHGIEAEVIDLRTIVPMDMETIYESVKKTHRLVVAHEAVKTGGVGGEIAASVSENILEYLDAPIIRVGAAFTPIPFSPPLEKRVIPQVESIVEAVLRARW